MRAPSAPSATLFSTVAPRAGRGIPRGSPTGRRRAAIGSRIACGQKDKLVVPVSHRALRGGALRFDARVGKLLGVAVLYAICGAVSFYSADWGDRFFKWLGLDILTPLPFALLSAALFLRSWRAVAAVPLNCAAWVAAYHIAVQVYGSGGLYFGRAYFATCLAGLAGGLGVALADSICCTRLLAPIRLIAAGFIGAVAGLPFGFSVGNGNVPWVSPCSFAIWQASMGTYLYYVCTQSREGTKAADSPQR